MSDSSTDQETLHYSVSPSADNDGVDIGAGGTQSPQPQDEPQADDEDDDPLSVKQLSLNFEYLMYKISDRVKTLSEQTEEVVSAQKSGYEAAIDAINNDLRRIERLAVDYRQIMNEFVKLEQLGYIVRDFNKRLADVERRMRKL